MKYLKLGFYIVSLDFIHGVTVEMREDKDLPYVIYLTYTDRNCVALFCKNKEQAQLYFDKIAESLGAAQ